MAVVRTFDWVEHSRGRTDPNERVPDETVVLRGVEHHTFVCSECRVTEQRAVFINDGRETDSPPMPMQAAPRIKRASTQQDEHVAAPGLLGRVMALIRQQ
jgi:hypothetical protein